MPQNPEFTKWKVLLETIFHCRHVKRWREIVLDLVCVDTGLKSGLLWDYTSLQKEGMERMLTKAKEMSLLNNSLLVISVEMDLIILNENSLRGDNSVLDLNQFKTVDVSCHLAHPRVVTDCEKLQETYNVYKHILKNKMDVSLRESDFNPSTLFGMLLGYPVVYWYEIEGEKDENCLSYQPLRVYKVIGCLEAMKEERVCLNSHVVFSFSVPECVVSEFRNCVTGWFETVYERKDWTALFNSIRLEEKTVSLPSVCL